MVFQQFCGSGRETYSKKENKKEIEKEEEMMPKRVVRASSREEAFRRVRIGEMLGGHCVPISARPIVYEVTYRQSKTKKRKK